MPHALRHGSRAWLLAALLLLAGIGQGWAQSLYAGRCAVRNPQLQGSYVGGCIGGWASGQGRAIGKDRYEGGFQDGHSSGRGVYTWADGRRFEGEFRQGRVNGRARYFYANGDMLEGEFRDNQLAGVGRLLRSGGAVQHVELREGVMVAVAAATGLAPTPQPGAIPGQPWDAAAAGSWHPQLDFDDLFPSYLFATATRKPPSATREVASGNLATRVQSLSQSALAGPVRRDATTARYAGAGASSGYLGDPWGLVGVRVQSPKPGTRVTVRVTIDEIADPTEEAFVLPDTGSYMLYPKIRYRYARLGSYTQPAPTNVTWSLTIDGQDAGTRVQTTRVRSIQDAPWQVRTDRGMEKLSWIFASFVTEDASWLDDLIREAFAGKRDGALGYQTNAAGVHEQVRAVYDLLKRRGVKYSSITTSSGSTTKVTSQIVRLPSDSMRTAQANCIDGSVLLASVLRKMGIEPFIVLVPGHAFMGYLAQGGKDPDVGFIETVMISSYGFEEARAEGLRKFLAAESKKEADLVFISEARRHGIAPIPR